MKIFSQSLDFVRRNCKSFLYPGETKLLLQTLSIVEMQILDAIEETPDDKDKFLSAWLEAALMFALVWGVGGILDEESRVKFDAFIRKVQSLYFTIWNSLYSFFQLWKGEDLSHPLQHTVDIVIPSEATLYDYVYFFKQKGFWRQWTDIAKMQKFEDLYVEVPTIDTTRYNHLFNMHIKVSLMRVESKLTNSKFRDIIRKVQNMKYRDQEITMTKGN